MVREIELDLLSGKTVLSVEIDETTMWKGLFIKFTDGTTLYAYPLFDGKLSIVTTEDTENV